MITRRDFLKTFVRTASDEWIVIGRMADFSPGAVNTVVIKDTKYVLKAHSEGFWLERSDGSHVALRTVSGGLVQANPKIAWPKNQMLSQITGEEKIYE